MEALYLVEVDLANILIPILSLVVSTLVTTVIGILIKRSFDKFFNKKEQEEEEKKNNEKKLKDFEVSKEREERKKDMKEAIEEAVEPIKQDLYILKKGTQAGLRHDLCLIADEWLIKGYCPRNVKVDFENLYNQYHQLGKNGVMDNTYQSILALPESKPKTPRTKSSPKKTTKKTTLDE